MSAALVRQALSIVDPEESVQKGSRRARQRSGQDRPQPYKRKQKKNKESKSEEQIAEENIKKLLALSQPTANGAVAEKIVKRAVKGKPLIEIEKQKKEKQKSILFPDEEESFEDFEQELFCS